MKVTDTDLLSVMLPISIGSHLLAQATYELRQGTTTSPQIAVQMLSEAIASLDMGVKGIRGLILKGIPGEPIL